MPELPEVETYRGELEPRLLDRTLERVVITDPRLTLPREPGEVAAELEGQRIAAVERRGKYLLLGLEAPGEGTLVVHLRMSGQLVLAAPGDPMARHTHAVLGLGGGDQLRFVDPRTFGELFVTSASVPGTTPSQSATPLSTASPSAS